MIQLLTYFAAATQCDPDPSGSLVGRLLAFPHWYKYLNGVETDTGCSPAITNINDAWFILAAVIEIMLRVAALAAIAMVIAGGVQYITSEGNPDKTKKALNTILMAVIGLAISISAAAVISFIAGRFN